MDMGNMSGDGTMNMKMQNGMSFQWSTNAIILFSGWPGGHSPGMYILSLFLVFFMAAAVEVLSVPIAFLKAAGVPPMMTALSQACVYGFRVGVSYLVMLSLMSFNVGVFIVAVAGHGVGFFLVKASSSMEHFFLKQEENHDVEESFVHE
ncbi:copper transporter 2-like [Humulus lupulus]|uniref:copper transporter 2-like n=1 Tax=Humulus lupulus TaxID=3486 RepID=UPI002B4045D9|nr:copper transporter 2-like [Humulus lupulus]